MNRQLVLAYLATANSSLQVGANSDFIDRSFQRFLPLLLSFYDLAVTEQGIYGRDHPGPLLAVGGRSSLVGRRRS